MSYEDLSNSVKLSEGFRNKIYQDTEGFDTIGWGHKVVSADNFVAGKEYTEEELQEVFDKDLSKQVKLRKPDIIQSELKDRPNLIAKTRSETIKTKSSLPNGRLNEDTILLRVHNK